MQIYLQDEQLHYLQYLYYTFIYTYTILTTCTIYTCIILNTYTITLIKLQLANYNALFYYR